MNITNKIDYSKYRLSVAKDELFMSEIAFANLKYVQSLSSSYYAIFHSIRALLAFDNFNSKTHNGVIFFFSEKYIKTGIFDQVYSKYVSNALTKRMLSDYRDFYIIPKEKVLKQLDQAKEFVNVIEAYLNKHKYPLQLKVCGMRDDQNIKDLIVLKPDFIGFIFFERSPRNVGENLNTELLLSFPSTIKKVGVFVDATIDFIKEKRGKYKLDYIQLHGHETPEYCHQLSTLNYQLIKAFSVNEDFDFSTLKAYESSCEFFLLDTKGKNPGGNGLKFNWVILEKAKINKPFFLSGGIELEDIEKLWTFNFGLSTLYAIDINSKFEKAHGLKDIEKIKKLKIQLDGNTN
jgi:phosphoribosylanthranilate isomerase